MARHCLPAVDDCRFYGLPPASLPIKESKYFLEKIDRLAFANKADSWKFSIALPLESVFDLQTFPKATNKPFLADEIACFQLTEWLKASKGALEAVDSEGEEIFCDSQIQNCLLLTGPTGCGKSFLVYKAARLLNYKVMQVSSVASRDFETMQRSFQESTVSHNILSLPQSAQSTLLLVEEIENVYEADKGFWSFFNGLFATSRRPLIFTTNLAFSFWKKHFPPQVTIIEMNNCCSADSAKPNTDCLDEVELRYEGLLWEYLQKSEIIDPANETVYPRTLYLRACEHLLHGEMQKLAKYDCAGYRLERRRLQVTLYEDLQAKASTSSRRSKTKRKIENDF